MNWMAGCWINTFNIIIFNFWIGSSISLHVVVQAGWSLILKLGQVIAFQMNIKLFI